MRYKENDRQRFCFFLAVVLSTVERSSGFIYDQSASVPTQTGNQLQLTTTVSTAKMCEDKNGIDCMILNSSVNICADFQKAKTICKEYCGLCNVIDGKWCPWETWSACDATCGNGSQVRNRQCTCPASANGGSYCAGDTSMTKECHLEHCPVHGHWARWSPWGSCSVTCGIGLERRDRSCSNPYPGPDGDPCYGDARDDRICFTRACAEGAWSTWSSWSTCSASCLGGLSTKTRLCNNPPPSAFGHACVGNNEETNACNTIPCPVVHGHWTSWSSWSTCDTHCVKKRTRSCTNPAPSTFGHTCSGNSEDKDNCDLLACSIKLRVRLRGLIPQLGRVEVSFDGVNWGTVCDDNFNSHGAKVVCRMLGLSTSSSTSYTAGGGSGPIFLDNVECNGSESSLLYCKHNRWNSENCDHSEDVGVYCV
ncbi:deleted in malignant brain tumors 1 protein-like [Mercenaria mercenaria]|uniref:deleted in malignant brain tumors 1 protein-like n=1 Tax=Mercenaria mercenaria TaxID=6596 RepID=UPI00234E8BEE|nr:deleted in malignant brain tumors 1 protein-like [Mercenaria mercenaria]